MLKGHRVDFFTWSDMPEEEALKMGVNLVPTEPFQWPLPTLKRYHLFLQQEQKLSEYDYIFYIDADMEVVSRVGDEILGKGLTMAQHPMYAVNRMLIPPYEPNPESAVYIKRPGRVRDIVDLDGKKKKWFEPLYAAGGFQGGRSTEFIKAMKDMVDLVNDDFAKNYIPIWNDETVWNYYLLDHPPAVVLSPSYVYPDSLINDYYKGKVWLRNYCPKIITLTKKFSQNPEGGFYLAALLN